MNNLQESGADAPVSTGLPELDYILSGGYARNRIHLIEGQPGAGKTTLALQFLLDGRARGECTLYVTLSESQDELTNAAASHGWDLSGIHIYELVPPELSLDPDREQSIVYASDLELGETVKMVLAEVERVRPARIVFDSLSEIRLLSQGALRYRRQVLALKHFFAKHSCTVLFLDDLTQDANDLNLHSLAHGVVRLEQLAPAYGAERRRLRVYKMRARAFRGGFHDFVIRTGGVQVFPRLVAASHPDPDQRLPAAARSGIDELDAITGGGLDYGTTTLVVGPAGSGKSTIAMQYAHAALSREECVFFISFDETNRNFMRRATGMGLDLTAPEKSGQFTFRQVDPAELSPGELAYMVRCHVEERGAAVVVIDSLTGYQHAMPQEQFMLLQLHEMVTFLNQQGILSFLVLAQAGMVGQMQSPVDLTYLADAVLLLRFFEAGGEIRRALSVLKKRTGGHEPTIRELRIDSAGLRVGPQLNGFSGVLTGTPRIEGSAALLEDRDG